MNKTIERMSNRIGLMDVNKELRMECIIGDYVRVKHLVENKNADIHNNNDNALFLAVAYEHLDIVEYLVEKGANIHKSSILDSAAFNGYLDIVKYLIKNGVDIHNENDNALFLAAERGHLDIVKCLISKGADIYCSKDYTICGAASYNHLHIVKYLIQFYNYDRFMNIRHEIASIYNTSNISKTTSRLRNQYDQMKFHVLLLYRIHDKKIPIELQKIIFDYL